MMSSTSLTRSQTTNGASASGISLNCGLTSIIPLSFSCRSTFPTHVTQFGIRLFIGLDGGVTPSQTLIKLHSFELGTVPTSFVLVLSIVLDWKPFESCSHSAWLLFWPLDRPSVL